MHERIAPRTELVLLRMCSGCVAWLDMQLPHDGAFNSVTLTFIPTASLTRPAAFLCAWWLEEVMGELDAEGILAKGLIKTYLTEGSGKCGVNSLRSWLGPDRWGKDLGFPGPRDEITWLCKCWRNND